MALPLLMIVLGLIILVWSADLFVDGAAAIARILGMPTLLIGMVVIGFGTSAPELTVSALSALQGNPGIALGNAYGSNITNIALILGAVAFIKPIIVQSQTIKKELPILLAVTLVVFLQIYDGQLSRIDALLQLALLVLVMGWMIRESLKQKSDSSDSYVDDIEEELDEHPISQSLAIVWLVAGLGLLIISSRMLVWGAVSIAHDLGASDLIIGLTIVAIGTSLPELASSLMAAKKGEDDLAIGNIIGSNLFNTLGVVGLAGTISPMSIPLEIIHRDWPLMTALTASLFLLSYRKSGIKCIDRVGGAGLLLVYFTYLAYLINSIASI